MANTVVCVASTEAGKIKRIPQESLYNKPKELITSHVMDHVMETDVAALMIVINIKNSCN